MLGDIEAIQRASMKPIKAGAMGSEVYAAAETVLAKSKYHNNTHFLGHGMGLVSHEAPRLTANGPVPYDDYDAHRPLEAGMVIPVETSLAHPKRGFVKSRGHRRGTDGCTSRRRRPGETRRDGRADLGSGWPNG
jgi:Xaa-Pro aminopeptidase